MPGTERPASNELELSVELEAYAGESRGAANALESWGHREGLLLRLRDADGVTGLGEASPLPGYSPDRFEDARRALEAWRPRAVRPNRDGVTAALAALPAGAPSARFAAETALLDLVARRAGRSYPAVLTSGSAAPAGSADAAALLPLDLDGDPGAANARADGLVRRGFRTLKVKVGRPGRFRDELRALRALRDHVGGGVALRLDANRAWPLREVDANLEQLEPLGIEFLEEPSSEPYRPRVEPPVPLALDESLRLAPRQVEGLVGSGAYRVAVLKPLVLGGALECLRLAEGLRSAGLDAVASHGFDGPVALQATSALALGLDDLNANRRAHGVGRHAGLDAWPDAGALWVDGAAVAAPDGVAGLGLQVPRRRPAPGERP